MRGCDLRIGRELPLEWDDRLHTLRPDLLRRAEKPQLVVHEDVSIGRVASLDVVERKLLVDVEQDMSSDGRRDPGPLDLVGLEDGVAVGEHDRRPKVSGHAERSPLRDTGDRRTARRRHGTSSSSRDPHPLFHTPAMLAG